MSEKEKIVMIQTILSFVEEIHKGQAAPGAAGIAIRMKHYNTIVGQFPPKV